mmetsp:Transcript_558/g.1344  ORF Transcript_558/g.1344 Transcript_558/m.1344 type:complete len:342 (+) Transcript_558:129-1154(+)|eukprot:CAMPEP_0119551164 /NCGR_PEP_ID=MMETSP1352-20130426/4491_1 /TAXON_ID=265584 /ORGANISM="Stauroneis constricta, Strain CCMP1120" /LENGTH=341 /DNA_ID=CAMNT_0007597173 /DNA_START=122 /DNA_END=1147 /DNA_ORIENTATION=-
MVQSDHSFPSFSTTSIENDDDTAPMVAARLVNPTAPPSYHDVVPMVVVPSAGGGSGGRIGSEDASSSSWSNEVFGSTVVTIDGSLYGDNDGNTNTNGSFRQGRGDSGSSTHGSIPEQTSVRGEDEDEETENQRKLVASGAAGAVLGMLIGGPYVGIIAGFGSAYASTQPEGTSAGDIGRAMAEVALLTKQKAIQIDAKHRIVDKVRVKLAQGWEYAKHLDREHHLLERLKVFVVWSVKTAIELAKNNRLLERGASATGRGIQYACSNGSGGNSGSNGNGGNNGTRTNTVTFTASTTSTANNGATSPATSGGSRFCRRRFQRQQPTATANDNAMPTIQVRTY